MKNVISVALVLLFAVLTAASSFSGEAPDSFAAAVKYYNDADYGKASEYFEKANSEHKNSDKAEVIEYAIKVLKNLKPYLDEIAQDELRFKKDTGDKALAIALSAKHYAVAKLILQDKFYLIIVEPHLSRAIELDPANAAARLDLGGAYYSSMQYIKALEMFEKVISEAPEHPYAYKMAGDACVAVGDFDKAKELYSKLLEVNSKALLKFEPSEIEKVKAVIKVLPQTYKDVDEMIKQEKWDEAEVVLKKRLSLNPGDCIALTELGFIYQDRGDRKNALKLLTSAVRVAPDYPPAHLYLGRLYFVMRNYEKAIPELNLFKEKMKVLPKMEGGTKAMYIQGLKYFSHVFFTLERYEEARSQIEEILKLDPKDQEGYYNLAIYYYSYERNRSKAYQLFMKAIGLDEKSETANDARYAIEFMRNNPDSRFTPDFSFIDRENK